MIEEKEEPIDEMFGLSYANYYVAPRSVLQSMPVEWQKKFVAIVEELNESIDWVRSGCDYHVIMTENVDLLDNEDFDYTVIKYDCGSDDYEEIPIVTDEFIWYRRVKHPLKKKENYRWSKYWPK